MSNPPSSADLESQAHDATRAFLNAWLKTAGGTLPNTARCCAVPHMIERDLLHALTPEPASADDDLTTLVAIGFVSQESANHFRFQPALRFAMLEHMQSEELAQYLVLSARAAAFFDARAAGESDELEFIYHQLGADEEAGRNALMAGVSRYLADHHLGVAERLLTYAVEQQSVLSAETLAWLSLFQSRLDAAHYRFDRSIEQLRLLTESATDLRLRAEVWITLSDALLASQRWSEASAGYAEAMRLYEQLGDRFRIAMVLQAQGLAYMHLAGSLGGIQEDHERKRVFQSLRERIEHAPFLAYRWLSRRFSFLPNVYFGADYQDWIIVRLLHQAIDCLSRAEAVLNDQSLSNDQQATILQTDIKLQLADLHHRVGRWSIAAEELEQLQAGSVIQSDPYRHAILKLTLGRASMGWSQHAAAEDYLTSARETFSRYGDQRGLAQAAEQSGTLALAQGRPDDAVVDYVTSLRAAVATHDLLKATNAWYVLEDLRAHKALSEKSLAALAASASLVERKAYIARFPGRTLQRFRKIAEFVAIPLTFLFVLAALDLLVKLAGITEMWSQLLPEQGPTALMDIVLGILIVLAMLLFTLWVYGFLYGAMGWLVVRRMKLDEISRMQPMYAVVDPNGIVIRDEAGRSHELAWTDLKQYVTRNLSLWSTPRLLFSKMALITAQDSIILEGIMNHCAHLQENIEARLDVQDVQLIRNRLDYSFLRNGGTALALLVSAGLGVISSQQWLDSTCRDPQSIQAEPASKMLYAAAGQAGLITIDVSNDYAPAPVSTIPTLGEANHVEVDGNQVYVAIGLAGVQIFDASDPRNLQSLSSIDTPGFANRLAVSGKHMYVADGPAGLQVIDISDPTQPRLLGSLGLSMPVDFVDANGSVAYVIDGNGGVKVIDVSNADRPVMRGSINLSSTISDATIIGNQLYLSTGEGLAVVDVTDPQRPKLMMVHKLESDARAVHIVRTFAFVVDTNHLHVFHLADPIHPSLRFTAELPTEPSAFTAGSHSSYIALRDGQVQVLGTNNPCDEITLSGAALGLQNVRALSTASPYSLPITTIVLEFLRWAVYLLPITSLVGLMINRRQTHHLRLGERLTSGGNTGLLVTLAVLIVMFLCELYKQTQ